MCSRRCHLVSLCCFALNQRALFISLLSAPVIWIWPHEVVISYNSGHLALPDATDVLWLGMEMGRMTLSLHFCDSSLPKAWRSTPGSRQVVGGKMSLLRLQPNKHYLQAWACRSAVALLGSDGVSWAWIDLTISGPTQASAPPVHSPHCPAHSFQPHWKLDVCRTCQALSPGNNLAPINSLPEMPCPSPHSRFMPLPPNSCLSYGPSLCGSSSRKPSGAQALPLYWLPLPLCWPPLPPGCAFAPDEGSCLIASQPGTWHNAKDGWDPGVLKWV